MSGSDLGTLVREIDDSIADNRKKSMKEIASYFETHQRELIEELLSRGTATIRTFAGEFKFSVDDLREALNQRQR